MQLDFSKIHRDFTGQIEHPQLVLKTKSGKIIGPLAEYFNLKMELKYNELSTVTFDYPAWSDGVNCQFYNRLISEMVVQLDPYGVFVIQDTTVSGDGIKEVKKCTCASLEYELASKQLTLEAGTYKFYDPIDMSNTILGRCLELTRGWTIGSVPSSLWSKYRTFDQTNKRVLDFILDDIQKTYECVVSFDTYTRTLNVVDASDKTVMLPIYLSFDNLLKSTDVSDKMDKFATRFTVNGADGVDIRSVNPTGTNQIIHLDYWIENGSIAGPLADHYREWENAVAANQAYYTSLIALQNATFGRYLTEKAKLTDLEGELTSLDNLRSVNLQGLNMAKIEGSPTQAGTRAYFNAKLDDISTQYTKKQNEIDAQKDLVDTLKEQYEEAGKDIVAVNKELAFNSYFSPAELKELDPYLIDGDFVDPTFAVFNVDISGDHDSFTKGLAATVKLKDVSVIDVEMTNTWECANHHSFVHTGVPDKCHTCGSTSLTRTSGSARRILAITGGTAEISGTDYHLKADIVRGTMDNNDGAIVLSAYLGSGNVNDDSFPSGNISLVGTSSFDVDHLLSGMQKVVDTTTDDETGVNHDDVHYEGNGTISISKTSIYFTRNVTEYQAYSVAQDLYDHALKNIEELAYPTYEFEVSSGNFIWAQEFEPFKNALRLGCGVYLRLNDETLLKPMLLEVHLNFENPSDYKMVFSSEFQTKRPDAVNKLTNIIKDTRSTSRTFNAERLKYNSDHLSGAAKALDNIIKTGINTAYQQVTAGAEQEVQANGAGIKVGTKGSGEYIILANGMIALIDDVKKAAKMAMGHFYNPEYGTDYYGILADVIYGQLITGNGLSIACPDINGGDMLFEADGKGVRLHNSRFSLDHDRGGQIILDPTVGIAVGKSGMYEFDDDGKIIFNEDKANLYIDMDGNLHVNGTGIFKGTIYATNGEFSGTLKAPTLDGTLVGGANGGAIEGVSLNIGGGAFTVSQEGNVHIEKGSISWGAVTGTGEIDQRIQNAQNAADHAIDAADDAFDEASSALNDVLKLAKGTYTRGTFINGTTVSAPEIIGGTITGGTIEGADIFGGRFGDLTNNDNPNVWLEMGQGSGQHIYGMKVFHKEYSTANPMFEIWDDAAGLTALRMKGETVFRQESTTVKPQGKWDFSEADEVKGVVAVLG